MVGDKAAIAVLGPTAAEGGERARTSAEAVGTELARLGYVIVVQGDGVTAAGAVAGATAAEGQVHTVCWPGHARLADNGTEPDYQADPLRALARVLELADAIVLLPGSLDSAATLLQIWLYGSTPQAPYRQTVLLGEEWTQQVASLAQDLDLDAKARAMVTFARTPKEAVEAMRYYISPLQGLPG